MEKNQIESMVQEIIKFLKKKKMWETDIAIYANGQRYHHTQTEPTERKMKGVAYMWFEGPLNHALNYGLRDPQYKILSGLNDIFFKYGVYAEFDNAFDFNIYPDPGAKE